MRNARSARRGVRYHGLYKTADGRYRSAGTFSTDERARTAPRGPATGKLPLPTCERL